jgi:MATE family multidrug resistance protein
MIVEATIPLMVFLGPRLNRELDTRRAWRSGLRPIRDLLKLGWPAAIQWGNELICWSIFMVILVGSFGDDHMTACTVAFGYMHLSFMPAVGLSVAVNSLVGRYIGAGQPDTAVARTRLALRMAMAYMTACAALFLIFRHQLVGWFIGGQDLDAAHAARIIEIGATLMILTAVFQTADAFGIIYTGALRGAGDTVWPGLVTAIYSWVFIIGLGWALTKVAPQLESTGPWAASALYVIVYGITMWARFRGGKWRSIRLLHTPEEAAAQVAPLVVAPPETQPDAAILDIAEGVSEAVAAEARHDGSEAAPRRSAGRLVRPGAAD